MKIETNQKTFLIRLVKFKEKIAKKVSSSEK